MDLSESTTEQTAPAQRHPWELSRRRFTGNLIASVERCSQKPIGRILDMGCGDAFVAKWLARRHANPVGNSASGFQPRSGYSERVPWDYAGGARVAASHPRGIARISTT